MKAKEVRNLSPLMYAYVLCKHELAIMITLFTRKSLWETGWTWLVWLTHRRQREPTSSSLPTPAAAEDLATSLSECWMVKGPTKNTASSSRVEVG